MLAVYLDNVLPGENKRARAPYYFLLPSYWVRPKGAACGLSGRQQQQLLQAAAASQQQRQQQQGDASLDMSGGYGSNGSSGSSIDAEVAAEEAAMQALLQELLPAAAGAGGAAAIAGVGVVGALGPAPSLKSTPSWPQLQVHSVSQQHGGGSGGSSAGSGTDADCQVADGDAASEKGGSSSNGSTGSGWDFAGYALAVFGLRKVFKAGCGAAGCCGKGGARDFHALAGVWLGIRPGQLFALLGPNGAGESGCLAATDYSVERQRTADLFPSCQACLAAQVHLPPPSRKDSCVGHSQTAVCCPAAPLASCLPGTKPYQTKARPH